VACKVWKNYGMESRTPDGRDVMVDDPLLEPIFAHLANAGLPVIMHIADPIEAWLPLDPALIHYGYYHGHPDYHVYGRTDVPSHAEITAARDRVLARHPDLRVVGAHLLSLEHDVREVAARFERHPNVAVDTSARLADIAWQERELVREFFLRWHDRILFGVDWGPSASLDTLADEKRREYIDGVRAHYELAVRFFSTDETMEMRGRELRGLALPDEVCEELFVRNAQRWLPGV
jgi:predicted TIM-barrel fold metal-dependent hydrolase